MLTKTLQVYRDSFSGLSREVWFLATVMFINRAGTMVISFLMIYLSTELGFSLTRAGIIMSFFGIGAVLGSYIGGWLTDRIGYFHTMFWSLFIGGLSLFILIPLRSFWAWCLGMMLVTTIIDSFRPANLAAVGIYSKPENRTRSLSLLRIAANLGLGLGPAIGGWVALTWGYDWLFIIDGITCSSAALAFFFLLPKKEKQNTDLETSITLKSPQSRSAYKDVFFLKFVFYTLLSMITFMHLLSLLPTYWKTHLSMTEHQVGYMFAANGIIIALLEMPIIYVLEKKYRLFPLIIVGAAMIGFGYLVLPASSWIGLAILSMLAITFGEIINFPFLNTIALNRAPEDRRGEYMGMYGMAFSIALIVAPTFGGWVSENWGFNTLWLILAGVSLISILGMQSLSKEYEQSKKDKESKKLELV